MFRSVFVMVVMGLCLQAARAQTSLPDRSGEETLACLQRPEQGLTYPENALELRVGGFYRIQMRFTDAHKGPETEMLFEAGSPELREAVLEHVARFRLPCLKPGEAVVALQEIKFDALGVGRVKSPPLTHVPAHADSYSHCMRTPGPLPAPIGRGRMPRPNEKPAAGGNTIANITFDSPDGPPKVDVIYSSMSSVDRAAIIQYVLDYRLPCLPEGKQWSAQQMLSFGFYGDTKLAFKDLRLTEFLGMVKNLESRPVDFDLSTMGCPFRLRWALGRPVVPNEVYQVGDANPNRLPLLAWLAELELNTTKQQFDSLLGAEMLIDVPCGTIRFGQPTAKAS